MNKNIYRHFVCFSLFFVACSLRVVSAEPVKLPAHPRLMVSQEEIPTLRARMDHPDFYEVKQAYIEQLSRSYLKNEVAKRKDRRPDEKIRQTMEALAFDYLINGKQRESSGKKAINLASEYLSTISDTKGYWENVQAYDALIGAAMVYDWCYDLISPKQKQILREEMMRVCSLCEYSFPDRTRKDYFAGHYGEQAPTAFLAMGLAFADEDRALFDFSIDEQVNYFAPSRNPMFRAQTHHQGTQYMHTRYAQEAFQAFILEKLGMNPYESTVGLPSFRGLYLRIPQRKDMDGMPDGDTHNNIYMGRQGYFLSATLSKDPFLQTVSRKYLSCQLDQSTRLFLFHDPRIASRDLNELCTSHFFPSPSGIMMARTAWDFDSVGYGSDVMVVQMNMKEYNSRNHDHSDAGHFSIYYKGHLALDAGIYQGKDPENGWGKRNFVNYYTRTVAHNSILVLDPNEPLPVMGSKRKCQARDGGQFVMKAEAWRHSREMFDAGKVAEIMAHDIAPGVSPDYTYLKGDMTRAYGVPAYIDPNYPSKVDTVRRSFVFLNHKGGLIPGTLIVLDKVVARDSTFRKSWLLHSQNEPQTEGDAIVFENQTGGRNGKLHTTMLLPQADNRVIEKIGGPGKEYWVDGVNWGTVTQEDAGRWRVEVGFRQPACSDNYLAVLQAMKANSAPVPYLVTQADASTGDFVVVEVADRLVAQSLTLDRHTSLIRFAKGDASKNYRVLITDLEAGRWEVCSPSGKFSKNVEAESGTIYVESAGGEFMLTYLE